MLLQPHEALFLLEQVCEENLMTIAVHCTWRQFLLVDELINSCRLSNRSLYTVKPPVMDTPHRCNLQ